MSKNKSMTFNDFKERVSTEEGLAKIDALAAQKILGKKVVLKNGKFYRQEPESKEYPRGGTFAIKQYTRSPEALLELIEQANNEEALVQQIYHNTTMNGVKNKAPRYRATVEYVDEDQKIQRIDQCGNNFNMNIITIAALLRWKGVLESPEEARK